MSRMYSARKKGCWKSAVWNGNLSTTQKSDEYYLIGSDGKPDIGRFALKKYYDVKEPTRVWFSHAAGWIGFDEILYWKEIGELPSVKKKT